MDLETKNYVAKAAKMFRPFMTVNFRPTGSRAKMLPIEGVAAECYGFSTVKYFEMKRPSLKEYLQIPGCVYCCGFFRIRSRGIVVQRGHKSLYFIDHMIWC